MISVAIDGPSGAGKSSLAKRLAKELGYIYVDTGAMYRTIGLYGMRCGKSLDDENELKTILKDMRLELKYENGAQQIYLNGENVSEAIRTSAVSMAASAVSKHPAVREFLLNTQRDMANTSNILMDGRDIGTVILPNATVKIFLTASAKARAQRRLKELLEKGENITFEEVLADINQRDYNDTHREIAPLKQAQDAVLIDTSDIDFEQSYALMLKTIKENIK